MVLEKKNSMRNPADPFDSLIKAIYDAAITPSLWPIFLEQLRGLLDAEFLAVVAIHKPTLQVKTLHHTQWDPVAINDLAARQLMRVPMREQIAFGAPDTPHSSLSLMSEPEFARTDFYQDWMAPNGLRDGATCAIIDNAEEHLMIGMVTALHREPVSEHEMTMLARLSPHLRRALMIGQALENTREGGWKAGLALAALARIDTPILICDAEGHMVFANPAGEISLREERFLLVHNGQLEPRDPQDSGPFIDALQHAASGETLAAQRSFGLPLLGTDGVGYAYILPLHGGVQAQGAPDKPLVAVFLATSKGQPLPEKTMLRDLFNLSPAEIRIALCIGQGQSVPTTAESLQLSVNTVKTHLAHVFRKTGCATQAELVKLIADFTLPVSASASAPPHPLTRIGHW
jgi:DNA-binding CsgD family transcriptional regulator